MGESLTIRMGDYPAGFDTARMLLAELQGMAMVEATDDSSTSYTVMLACDDGTCPVEVKPEAFAEIAAHCVYKPKHKPILVLQRVDLSKPFGFLGFVDEPEAQSFLARLRADR